MAVTPLLLLAHERWIAPRVGTRSAPEREPDARDDGHPVLIAGFGGFGSMVGRMLRANGVGATVLDVDSDRVDLLRALGFRVYYGDATRHDLLRTAGAERARLLVLAVDSPARTLELVATARRHFPHLTILARAFDWDDAYELLNAGVTHVYRESADTSLRLGADALRLLGFRAHQAQRAVQRFQRHDDAAMRDLAERRREGEAVYLRATRQRIEQLEEVLQSDLAERAVDADSGWDPESLREEVLRTAPAPPPRSAPRRRPAAAPPPDPAARGTAIAWTLRTRARRRLPRRARGRPADAPAAAHRAAARPRRRRPGRARPPPPARLRGAAAHRPRAAAARARRPHLSTAEVVHEAFLDLLPPGRVDWQSRAHFFAVASRAMRNVLVDHAARRGTAKRGAGARPLPLDDLLAEQVAAAERPLDDLIALEAALTRLEALDPRKARVVECRFFGGMSLEETAEALGSSPAT
jgi:RNA polymerase sigma factor (TIGR02999 family)